MANDALLGSTGPVGVAGNPVEAAAVTADAVGTKGYVWFGTYKSGVAVCRIGGAFDRTTGDETLAFEVLEATDAAGTGAAVIATSAALTATHIANLGASTANGKAAGTLATGPTRVGFATGAGGYIAANFNVAGTSPSAASLSVDFIPSADAVQASGR